jgi:distribution and morphology protein 12
MSIDLNWETVTGGPDGQELADSIRDFIHTKFQSVPLPRFIKSVTVHDFQFGTIPPEIELKDITDPLPDFYEDHVDSDLASDSDGEDDEVAAAGAAQLPDERRQLPAESGILTAGPRNFGYLPPHLMLSGVSGTGVGSSRNGDMGSPFMRASTPGIPGGTANLHYFHSHLASGLSGTQTPLAAVAGAQHLSTANWLEGHGHSSSVPNLHQYSSNFGGVDSSTRRHPGPSHSRNPSQSSISIGDFSSPPTTNLAPPASSSSLGVPSLREKHRVSTLAPTSAGTASRPPTRDAATTRMGSSPTDDAKPTPPQDQDQPPSSSQQQQREDSSSPRLRQRRIDDVQAVFRIRYAGDVKLLLTADILLDYPMPSFVGIPIQLSITGLTFDGVGVLAQIRKRVHFCFLSPDDAVAAVGNDDAMGGDSGERPQGLGKGKSTKVGGLLQEIRVESEIGQRESGKQSLKNVGKVERFVLEQVRRIFEEEFVYPSFWTFLV